MKIRDSGMPDEKIWESFFNVEMILSELEVDSQIIDLVEIGSGYGTFTLPAAKIIKGLLYAFDIEPEMIFHLEKRIILTKTKNVKTKNRDILRETTGLPSNSADYVMLFNIMHHESPDELLDESYRILKPGGKTGIIHWRTDIETPRGPDMEIRPKPEQIIEKTDIKKFKITRGPVILEPFHYGLVLSKRS